MDGAGRPLVQRAERQVGADAAAGSPLDDERQGVRVGGAGDGVAEVAQRPVGRDLEGLRRGARGGAAGR
ncbi:hypothetical protein FHU36_001270 [Nonomuraea muscovyensis]|uniref:Uncharacterized protein n=1 Tax=Nonomuraea muscovyensis TaxID=1124761 RepID=A0A7X0BZ14_9ACTN|nr:hypothetical protein [Nonomuraea muscovyensis]MBB6344761.1 hypothetical protein [Nonomuraea muscovyensis]